MCSLYTYIQYTKGCDHKLYVHLVVLVCSLTPIQIIVFNFLCDTTNTIENNIQIRPQITIDGPCKYACKYMFLIPSIQKFLYVCVYVYYVRRLSFVQIHCECFNNVVCTSLHVLITMCVNLVNVISPAYTKRAQ